jgi:feruloyl-CoA synthase
MGSDLASVPFRDTGFLPVDLDVERRADGSLLLRSRIPLADFESCLPRVLEQRAREHPDQPYLLQRRGPERAWVAHSYGATRRDSLAIAQWLLDRGASRERPILILSGSG